MSRMLVLVTMSLMAIVVTTSAQSTELEVDEASSAESAALEEYLETLRRAPVNLRRARVNDLLAIPGVRRTEAERIVRAVRAGAVADLRAIDFIPGVRSGTAERLAPFVTLGVPSGISNVVGRVRSVSGFGRDDRPIQLERQRVDLSIMRMPSTDEGARSRWEARRTFVPKPLWTTYAEIPMLEGGLALYVGDLDAHDGLALTDRGRGASVLKPSDWPRRLRGDPKVRPGYDPGTARRGVALTGHAGAWSLLGTLLEGPERKKNLNLALSSSVVWDMDLCVALHDDPFQGGVRLERAIGDVEISIESLLSRAEPSWVAYASWGNGGRPKVQWLVRRLPSVKAAGVPRLAGATAQEDAAGLTLFRTWGPGSTTYLVGDVGRERDTKNPNADWAIRTALGAGGETRLSRDVVCGIEWSAIRRVRRTTDRWTLQWRQSMTRALSLRASLSRRAEIGTKSGVAKGAIAAVTVTWMTEAISSHVRVVAGGGDREVEFWMLGSGPASLSGFQRFSGEMAHLQCVVMWQPSSSIAIGSTLSWRARPALEVRSSILLEIQL